MWKSELQTGLGESEAGAYKLRSKIKKNCNGVMSYELKIKTADQFMLIKSKCIHAQKERNGLQSIYAIEVPYRIQVQRQSIYVNQRM